MAGFVKFWEGQQDTEEKAKSQEAATLLKLHQERICQLERELDALRRSYSWRITWPLRQLSGLGLRVLANVRSRLQRSMHNVRAAQSRAFRARVSSLQTFVGNSLGTKSRFFVAAWFDFFRHQLCAKFPRCQRLLDCLTSPPEPFAADPQQGREGVEDALIPALQVSDPLDCILETYDPAQGVHYDLRSPLEAHYWKYRRGR